MALAVLDLFYFIFNILTLITDVSTLDGGLCTCAAAAMLAMVLRWFIWLIAIVTDAGGRLTGINGWGIIIKGSSSPGGEKINENRITSFLSLSLSIYFYIYIYINTLCFFLFSPHGQYSTYGWQDGSHIKTKQQCIFSFLGCAHVNH